MLILQMILYCALFAVLVKGAVRDNGLNCLYFYPKEYIEEAEKRGLADKEEDGKGGRTPENNRSESDRSCKCGRI